VELREVLGHLLPVEPGVCIHATVDAADTDVQGAGRPCSASHRWRTAARTRQVARRQPQRAGDDDTVAVVTRGLGWQPVEGGEAILGQLAGEAMHALGRPAHQPAAALGSGQHPYRDADRAFHGP
jgi:hypothetical protein